MVRETIAFDENWRFHKGDIVTPDTPATGNSAAAYRTSKTERALWGPAARDYEDGLREWWGEHAPSTETWKVVTLPHDYVIEEVPNENCNNSRGYLPYENGWYRKHFPLTGNDMDKRITLLFEGVAGTATVYLNGCLVYRSFSNYAPFEVDITDYADFTADNVVAVHVDAGHHEGWWYEGGGINRHVWLRKTAPIAVELWGIHVKPKKIMSKTWQVDIDATLCSILSEERLFFLHHRILDSQGQEVACCETAGVVLEHDSVTLTAAAIVKEPALWDIDDPQLYVCETTVTLDGDVTDVVTQRFGFRIFELKPNSGLYLNDKPVYLNGVCAHGDCGLFGRAVPDNIDRHRAKLLKEMGANGYRTAHYPHSQAMMDALDELGFIVLCETRRFEVTEESLAALQMLIRRDRNHPSVFAWSLGNEEPYHTKPQGARIFRTMKAVAKRLDDTRFFTTVVSNDPPNATVYDDCDIIAVNYNLDSYESIHKKYPTKLIMAGECCATSSTRGWYRQTEPTRGYMSAYDGDTSKQFLGREHTKQFMAAQPPYLIGGFQWAGFEHRGETVWPRLCSQAGAIDLYLQKKDAFYQNLSHWSKEPMLHLLPHWNHEGREDEIISVWAYTNCSEAELYLNGVSMGVCTVSPYGHARWQVPYTAGELVCIGRCEGKEAVRDSHSTSGKPYALALRAETDTVCANGQDAALFTCYCVDDSGRPVPDAAPLVEFETNEYGYVMATGSDVCDHMPPVSPLRRMRAGTVTVAVKVGKRAGALRLVAKSVGLVTGSITLELTDAHTVTEQAIAVKGQND